MGHNSSMAALAKLAGRIMMAVLFIMAGYGKINGYEGTQGFMESMGVPGILLPAVILLELGGGIALVVGYQTRLVALAMAAFCIATAVIFHFNFADQMQTVLFMKNLGLAGGFLVLFASGAGQYSLDKKQGC